MTPLDAFYIALATYAVAYMVSQTSGPLDIFSRLRDSSPVLRVVLSCYYCLAVWVALFFMLIYVAEIGRVVTLLFAVTGAAYIAHRVTS